MKKHRGVKVLLWIVIVILAIVIFALIFMRAYPVFGGRPTSVDREDYAKRAEGYFDGKKFYYPSEWELTGITEDKRVLRQHRTTRG